jgi:hypothetical protein
MVVDMRVVTWNIAGGRTIRSNRQFDYEAAEDSGYFIGQLQKLDADILCLQEAHGNDNYSLACVIADALHLPYVYEVPTCPSHIDPRYFLYSAILAKRPFVNPRSTLLPHPPFQLYLHGQPVEAYDRYLLAVDFSGVTVATMHLEPLSILGYSYSTGPGLTFARDIDALLVEKLRAPLLFTADLYAEAVPYVFPQFTAALSLQDALPEQMPTTPQGERPDHILYSRGWQVAGAQVLQTKTDHYLCCADLIRYQGA